jgi:hypothetical protein
MKVTKEELKIKFRDYGEIIIPKGTRTTNKTACGIDENYNFVDNLSWIPTHDNGVKQYGLIHDATYYGINIPKDKIEEI